MNRYFILICVAIGISIASIWVVNTLNPTLIIIITGLMLTIFCAKIVRICSIGRIWMPSIPIVFIFIFVVLQYLGNLIRFDSTSEGSCLTVLGLSLGLVSTTIGVVIGTIVMRFNPGYEIQRYLTAKLIKEPRIVVQLFILLAVISIGISFLYFWKGGGIPLISGLKVLISGGDIETARNVLSKERILLTYAKAGRLWGQEYFEQFRLVLVPFATIFLLFYIRKFGYKVPAVIKFILLGITIFLLVAAGQRHPILRFLIALFVTYGYLSPSRNLVRVVVNFGLLAFFAMLSITLIQGGRTVFTGNFWKDIIASSYKVWSRILYTNANVTLKGFELFPNVFPYQHGGTWLTSLSSMLPGSTGGFGVKFYEMTFGGIGSAPINVFGEFYINFGFWGIVVGAFFMGFVLQWLHITFIRCSKSLINIVTVGFAGSALAIGWATGGLLAFISMGTIAIFIFWLIIKTEQSIGHHLFRNTIEKYIKI